MSRSRLLLTCVFTLLNSRYLLAQQDIRTLGARQIGHEARVRILLIGGEDWQVGSLAWYRTDSLAVRPCPSCAANVYQASVIRKFEASRGRRSGEYTLVGGCVGLVVGTIAGAIHGSKAAAHPPGEGPPPDPIADAVGYGALGALAGAFAASLIRTERWVEVSIHR
jgi:hypothetical protein